MIADEERNDYRSEFVRAAGHDLVIAADVVAKMVARNIPLPALVNRRLAAADDLQMMRDLA